MPESDFSNFSAYVTVSINCKLHRKAIKNIKAVDEEQVRRFLDSLLNTAEQKLIKIHKIVKNRK